MKKPPFKPGNRPARKRPTNLIFGLHPVEEALAADKPIDKLLIQKGLQSDAIRTLTHEAHQRGIPISYPPLAKLNQLAPPAHQGVMAYLAVIGFQPLDEIVARAYEEGREPFLLLLDQVTDVRNFGAIARTAECAGLDAIIVPAKGGAQIGPDAVKTSAGALHHIPICREGSLEKAVDLLQGYGLQIVACSEKADHLVYEADFTKPSAIIMGAEDTGISPTLLAKADVHLKIPMFGQVGSLNVSVATGVVLFESIRQKSASATSTPQ